MVGRGQTGSVGVGGSHCRCYLAGGVDVTEREALWLLPSSKPPTFLSRAGGGGLPEVYGAVGKQGLWSQTDQACVPEGDLGRHLSSLSCFLNGVW